MAAEQNIQVSVQSDRRCATLILNGSMAPELMSAELVGAVARRAGVVFNADVAARVHAAVAAYSKEPRALRVPIAVAKPPTEPVDGGLVWVEGFDPDQPEKVELEGGTDHYAGRRLVTVRAGDVVAAVRAGVNGADGQDVMGGVLKSRAPRASTMKVGAGLTLGLDGRVVVDRAGVLQIEDGTAKISDQMSVAGDVDFATGNIDFAGAVSISGGVKPCFAVKASGDVQIGGLVEDATMNCGGSLDCRRGITAKSHGEVKVGGRLHAVFLNCINGTVGTSVQVQREIMNCQLEVRGDVVSPRAVLLGGKTTVSGCVELNEIGSSKWKETDLVLGWSVRAAIDERVAALQAEMAAKKAMCDQIKMLGKRATAAQRESLTELEFGMWEFQQELTRRRAELESHVSRVQLPAEEATRTVVVHKCIHPKVRIHLGGDVISFTTAVQGPLRIWMDAHDRLVGSVSGGEARWLPELARGMKRAA